MGIFPKDHEIRVSKLLKLWVAEGFLNESGSQSFEETGEECLEDLVKRSLVSVAKRRSNGRIKSLFIHECILDFCIRQSHEDKFLIHIRRLPQQCDNMELQRRVSIYNCEHDFLKNVRGSTIRTIIGFDDSQQGTKWTLRDLKLLRVLDISNAYAFFNLDYFPEEVFKLSQVRYLAFNHELGISRAISNFENLETLIIRPSRYRRGFLDLPVEIWRMRRLRHLIVHSCLLPCQETTFVLENLQTLTQVVDFICSRESLKMHPNLKKLGIFSTKSRDYHLHDLIYPQDLEIMKIEAHNLVRKQRRMSPFCHPTLKELSLSGLLLPWDDMKIVGSLPNLRVLKLRNHACFGSTWETNEGGFRELNSLLIEGSNLEQWIAEAGHFPKLKCLQLHDCEFLRKVPNDIPTLELIEVDQRNKSLMQLAMQVQQDRRCGSL